MEILIRILFISLTWIVIQLFSGWIAHQLSPKAIDVLDHLLKTQGFEQGGRLYQKIFCIKSWKDRLPEAGAFFAGGIAKNRLSSSHLSDLLVFYRETVRAEFSHWLPFFFSWSFFIWNKPDIAIWMPPIGFLGNLPFLLIQRYNRARIEPLLQKLQPESLPHP